MIKLLATALTVCTALVVLIGISFLLLRKFRVRKDAEGALNPAFGTWFACLFLSGMTVVYTIISSSTEATEVLLSQTPNAITAKLATTVGLIIAAGFGWWLCWYFIAQTLSKLIAPGYDELEEMAENRITYFIVRGSILLGIIIGLQPVLTALLRLFIPVIVVPFYH